LAHLAEGVLKAKQDSQGFSFEHAYQTFLVILLLLLYMTDTKIPCATVRSYFTLFLVASFSVAQPKQKLEHEK
jgi:hypothetical protein